MSTIALWGASGAMGQSIAAALRAQGRAYRVVGRSAAALRAMYGADPLAEIAVWSPDSPASVQQAAQGIETLVYLVGVNYWQFELHPELMRKTLEGAMAAGVRNVVLIGTVYPYGRAQGQGPVGEDHPRAPHTFKGRMRKAQEDVLMQAHASGRIRATVLRLPDFFGPGVDKSLLHGVFQATAHGGVANMVGPIDVPHEFIFVPDVGPVVLRLADTTAAYGRTWHLAGPGVTTQQALLAEMERQCAHPIRRRVAGKTLLRVLGWFNPLKRELVEMHYLMSDPLVLDDSALQQLIGPIRKTGYAEGVRRTLLAEKAGRAGVLQTE